DGRSVYYSSIDQPADGRSAGEKVIAGCGDDEIVGGWGDLLDAGCGSDHINVYGSGNTVIGGEGHDGVGFGVKDKQIARYGIKATLGDGANDGLQSSPGVGGPLATNDLRGDIEVIDGTDGPDW